MFADLGFFLRFHEYAVETQCPFIERLRVTEWEES